MKNKKKIISLILSSLFTLSIFTPTVFASNSNINKEESVYVISDANGNVNKKIVSVTLKGGKKGEKIEDKTNLKDIENLKGDETFDKKFSKVIWNSKGKDITYQGTSNKKLPVNIKLTYYLNGEKTSPKDIAKKSGKIKIRIDYDNVTFKNNAFMAVTGMVLDSSKISNIKVTNGKSVDEGENTVVMCYAFPGLNESLSLKEIDIPSYSEITFDAKDFTMDGTMSYVTNEVFKDIDLDDVDSIMDLTNSLNKLSSSSKELVNGSKSLNEGINLLIDKSGTLTTGIDKLNNGAKQLASGSEQIKSGANDIKDGANLLSDNISKLSSGIKTTKEGSTKLKDGINTAGNSLGDTITYNEQVLNGLNSTIEQLEKSEPDSPLLGNLKTMQSTLSQTISAQKQIQYSLTNNNEGTLLNGASSVESGLDTLYSSSNKLKTDGSDQIVLGVDKLINQGINPLIQGSKDLDSGLTTLKQGSDKLIEGISALEKGSKELEEGMNTFDKEGIEKLVSTFGSLDNLKARLHTIIENANSYDNFTGLSDGMNGSVKFIYKTEAIK